MGRETAEKKNRRERTTLSNLAQDFPRHVKEPEEPANPGFSRPIGRSPRLSRSLLESSRRTCRPFYLAIAWSERANAEASAFTGDFDNPSAGGFFKSLYRPSFARAADSTANEPRRISSAVRMRYFGISPIPTSNLRRYASVFIITDRSCGGTLNCYLFAISFMFSRVFSSALRNNADKQAKRNRYVGRERDSASIIARSSETRGTA